jgi:hypothetical protein
MTPFNCFNSRGRVEIPGRLLAAVHDSISTKALKWGPVGSAEPQSRSPRAGPQRVRLWEATEPLRCRFRLAPGAEEVLATDWDLARAIGADERLDPDLVEAAYDFYKAQELILRACGLFGRNVDSSPEADTQTKLLAPLVRRA